MLDTHHYTSYVPKYTPPVFVHITTHLICFSTHHYTPYMPWYTSLCTLYALVQPLHTFHTLVYTTTHLPDFGTSTHLLCVGTHYYSLYYMPMYDLLQILHISLHTTTCQVPLYTPYMPQYTPNPFYTPLHTLYALVHTITHIICLEHTTIQLICLDI